MTEPADFERFVAADFRRRGYRTEPRGGTNDWGVDLFATKGRERLAIQAKMYAGARAVNRRQVFELYGAARYFDCTACALATDGALAPDAAEAAAKLGVEVLLYGQWAPETPVAKAQVTHSAPDASQVFDSIWEQWILPLVGEVLGRADGSTNEIVAVDWSGITRRTSSGNTQFIEIEIFRWAIERIYELGSVTRQEINDRYERRASSGIALILGQVPIFEVGGRPLTISLREVNG